MSDRHLPEILACLERAIEDRSRLDGVTPDTHLFENAVLDSVATLQVLVALEEELGVKLDEDAVFSEEFATMRGIAGLIEKAKNG